MLTGCFFLLQRLQITRLQTGRDVTSLQQRAGRRLAAAAAAGRRLSSSTRSLSAWHRHRSGLTPSTHATFS